MPKTRRDTEIELIGNATPEICGNQLPSNKQILQCYYYQRRHAIPKPSLRETKRCVVRKCVIFWEYAGIPICKESYAIEKLDKLIMEYESLLKYKSRQTPVVQEKRVKFICKLEDLFDIALQKEEKGMKNEQTKTLLSLHRETGRNGRLNMIIDTGKWVGDTQEENDGGKIESLKQDQPGEIAMNCANYLFDEDEDLDELLKEIADSEETDKSFDVKLPTMKPKKSMIMTPNLTAVLDRAKVSDRMAARVIAAILLEAGITLEEVFLSHETVRRNRRKNRELLRNNIRDDAQRRKPQILGVHWDGRQESTPENRLVKIDRLSVLAAGHEWHQFLGVPRLDRGTGEAQAEAVHKLLEEWDLLENVCTMVFDTTVSNTGNISGACICLEKLVGRDLLHLACRHHVLELLLRYAFEAAMGYTSGPDVPIFKRFQGQWPHMTKEDFSPGINEVAVKEALQHEMKNILAFAEQQLESKILRMDYREFLELVVMFLGGNLTTGNRFRALIDIHHARWMSKAIYSLKVFLFREQFQLTPREKSGLIDICVFVVFAYQKAWFTASDTVAAPNNDLELFKKLAANASPSSRVSVNVWKAALDKFVTHLWYLSEELIGFAFFDQNVSIECKRKMCQAIKSRSALDADRKKRKTGINDLALIPQLTLDLFVTKNTIKFFEILKIDISFLDSDPITWEKRDDFSEALKIVKSLHVTNDIAERSVALVSEYNNLLTKDEKTKQNLLLVVKKFREYSPGCTRKDLQLRLEDFLNSESMETPSCVD